jgi:putative transposase
MNFLPAPISVSYDHRMSDYRRYFVAGGTYFFTVVTDGRAALFADEAARTLLGSVMRRCFLRRPVTTIAMVLLPEHLHCLWALPPGDSCYSVRWSWIKREFTRSWLSCGGSEQPRSDARRRDRRRNVWQRRFWEHAIRDEADLEAHFDYIHYNPVKHGHVASPRDWPWSTFHRWVRAGHYSPNWGRTEMRIELPNAGE